MDIDMEIKEVYLMNGFKKGILGIRTPRFDVLLMSLVAHHSKLQVRQCLTC